MPLSDLKDGVDDHENSNFQHLDEALDEAFLSTLRTAIKKSIVDIFTSFRAFSKIFSNIFRALYLVYFGGPRNIGPRIKGLCFQHSPLKFYCQNLADKILSLKLGLGRRAKTSRPKSSNRQAEIICHKAENDRQAENLQPYIKYKYIYIYIFFLILLPATVVLFILLGSMYYRHVIYILTTEYEIIGR